MKWMTALITAVAVPTIAIAQQPTYGRDTARAQGHDKTHGQPAKRDQQKRDRQVRAESRGTVETSRRGPRARATWGLTTGQITQLQQSLQSIDCYDAEIDGLIGPRTRAGIACAKRHHNVTGEDPNELLRALGLDFEVDAKAGLGAVMRSGAASRDRRNMPRVQRDTTDEANRRDSLERTRPTTNPDPQNVPG